MLVDEVVNWVLDETKRMREKSSSFAANADIIPRHADVNPPLMSILKTRKCAHNLSQRYICALLGYLFPQFSNLSTTTRV